MRIYSLLFVFSSIFLTGCFTVPGRDKIITFDSYVNRNVSCIQPLSKPISITTYVPADQSFKSKLNYINQCMINYSYGRGWNNCTNFQN